MFSQSYRACQRHWTFPILLFGILLVAPANADATTNHVWVQRTFDLTNALLNGERLPEHSKDYVRDVSAHVLAAKGCVEETLSLLPAGEPQKAISFRYFAASGFAQCGDLEAAFRVADPLPRYGKLRAFTLVAVERIKRRDMTGLQVALAKCDLDSFDPENRDSTLKSIVSNLSDVGELDEAHKLVERISDPDLRTKLEERINKVGRLLVPSDPGYLDQQIRLAIDQQMSEEDLQYTRALRSAEVAAAEGRTDFAKVQLQKVIGLVKENDSSSSVLKLLQIGDVAEKAGVRQLAQTAFEDALKEYLKREHDLSILGASPFFLEPSERWKSVGRVVSLVEIEEFLSKARERKDNGLVAALIVSLAASEEPQRVEEQYELLDSPEQKWLTAYWMLKTE